MAELSVSVPYGGGTVRTYSNTNSVNNNGARAHCWLGGTTTDKNLWIQVRLQQDPDLAIIDVFKKDLRTRDDTTVATHGGALRSQIYALGGEAFNTNVDQYNGLSRRRINVVRLNSTTALLKVPYSQENSTNYVLEVDESTGIVTHYAFEGVNQYDNGGLYDPDGYPYDPSTQYGMFMQNVEDNVVVTVEVYGNSNTMLVQKVWDPVGKTLTSIRVASADHGSTSIVNFSTNRHRTRYGGSGINGQGSSSVYFGNRYQYTNGGYVFAVEGRDGKWYFREARSWSSNHSSISGMQPFAFVYIPTSMGGNNATSGRSESWGLLTGLDNNEGLDNNQSRFGSFLPVNVKEATTANGAHSNVNSQHISSSGCPTFHAETYIELGHSQMLVHMDGAPQTKMWYTTSYQDTSSNARCKWASWLDSNHFAIHAHSNTSSDSFCNENSNNKISIIQYVDENYVVHQGSQGFSQQYNNQTSSGSAQWTKVDDYTVVGNGFQNVMNFWAPE